MRLALLSALLIGLGAAAPRPVPPYPDGEALLRAMHSRYEGKWYRSATFVQTTTLSRPTPHTETWYEALTIPGQLRIDIAPLDSGNTLFFRGDSIYQVEGGVVKVARPFVHPLMVLGFDVYADPPETTIGKLRALGFDLSTIHEADWQGRPAWVVGAAAGDSATAQFWVDQERLLFVRMLQPAQNGSGAITETQFNRYQPLKGGWMSVEVVFNVDGKQVSKEEYADVKADLDFPPALFDPAQYEPATWMK